MSQLAGESKDNESNNNGNGSNDKRSQYYSKWSTFAKETNDALDEEDAKEKEEADKALGLDKPKSKAEAQDKQKHNMLKEAKKMWENREKTEKDQKVLIENESDLLQTVRIIDVDELGARRVICFNNNENCEYDLPSDLTQHAIIKVFIENCSGCTFNISCRIITSCIEVTHCENCTFNIKAPLATMQCDLSTNLKLQYGQNVLQEKDSIYHSGCKNLTVFFDECGTGTVDKDYGGQQQVVDYQELGAKAEGPITAEEWQFRTHLHKDKLVTEKCVRVGCVPTTEREIEERKAKLREHYEKQREENKEKGKKGDKAAAAMEKLLTDDYIKSQLERESHQTNEELVAELKGKANACFAKSEYSQAIVYYTQAIGSCPDKNNETKAILYSNRSACSLKLGRPDEAIEDCKKCQELNPEYTKGWFREGLALHAMGKSREALPILGKALKLEPNNKQIINALRFAERKVALADARFNKNKR